MFVEVGSARLFFDVVGEGLECCQPLIWHSAQR